MALKDYRNRIEIVQQLKLPRIVGRDIQPWHFLKGEESKLSVKLAYEIPEGYSFHDTLKMEEVYKSICGGKHIEFTDQGGAVLFEIFKTFLPSMVPFTSEILTKKNLVIGQDVRGEWVEHTFFQPHMLIAGESGFGKTVFLKFLLLQILFKFETASVYIVDMKGTEYLEYDFVESTAVTFDESFITIRKVYEEMERRRIQIKKEGKRIEFPLLFLLIDEAADLSPSENNGDNRKLAKLIDADLSAIARKGRSFGIRILYGTQYPHFEIVNPQIRFNAGGRVCFHVGKPIYSEVVLGFTGAEELDEKGRCYYKGDSVELVQVPFLDDESEEYSELIGGIRNERIKRNQTGSNAVNLEKRSDFDHGTDSQIFLE